MLPFSFRGRLEVGLPEDRFRPANNVIAQIERELLKEKPRRLLSVGTKIAFVGGVFRRVPSWNLLGPIGRGEIEVRAGKGRVVLEYKLDFMQMFVMVTFMVGFVVGPAVLVARNLSLAQALALIAFAWLWLFGGNVLIALWRFPRALRRAVGGVTTEGRS